MTITNGREWTFDFLGTTPVEVAADELRQLREAENVLSSYSASIDLLAEALQNATDAVDARLERNADSPTQIHIRFDRAARSFSVADTGIGMSVADIGIVLTPNVTLKAGPLARGSSRRSRGEKGVGLTFLALAANFLQIQTCNGETRVDVTVRGANAWVRSGGTAPKPRAEAVERSPDQHLGSDRYTIVTIADLESEQFDRDLFALGQEELIWLMRTRTAVGNTRHLFREGDLTLFGGPADIAVTLDFRDTDGTERPIAAVPYRYATPEELVPTSVVVDFASLAELSPDELTIRLRGAAVRYVQTWQSAGGYEVLMYAFVMDGREMRVYEKEAAARGEFFPKDWQGFAVATRDMPTGIRFNPEVIQPRTYERRMFALLQYDGLMLDLGRKTLAGRTTRMLRDIVESAWKEDLQPIVPRVQPRRREGAEADRGALDALIARALALPDLAGEIPYLKEPGEKLGVVSVFHELIGANAGGVPRLRTLRSGLFAEDDALAYVDELNGHAPLHILFGYDVGELLQSIEREDGTGRTADLGVIWSSDLGSASGRGIQVVPASPSADRATHELMLGGIGDRESLRLIVLNELV